MQVLVLNASLKHGNDLSNTEEVTNMVLEEMRKLGRVDAETIRLADKRIPVGLGFRESDDDEWPEIADKLRKADIVIFATPIWWGQRSSLMQRVIERMDAFDEEAHSGRADLLNKVAGVVITGSEDGAQAVLAGDPGGAYLHELHAPAAVLHLLGRRGRPRPEDRPRTQAEEQGGGRHGRGDGAQSHVLRSAPQGTPDAAGRHDADGTEPAFPHALKTA